MMKMTAAQRKIIWAVAIGIYVAGTVGGVVWGWFGRPDWESFYPETRYFWQHGGTLTNGFMFGYLPAIYFLLWPFTVGLPGHVGLMAYVAMNGLAGAGSIAVISKFWTETISPCQKNKFFALLSLLVCVAFAHVLLMNQLTLIVLFLCVCGLGLSGKGKIFSGGLLVGLAGVIKVLPFVLAGYFLLRRKWLALVGMFAAVILFDIVPLSLFLGLQGMINEHRQWLGRAAEHSSVRQIEEPYLRGVYAVRGNFSLAAVMGRWLRDRENVHEVVALCGQVPAGKIEKAKAALQPGQKVIVDGYYPQKKFDRRKVAESEKIKRVREVSKVEKGGEEEANWVEKRVKIKNWQAFSVADFSAGTVEGIWAAFLVVLMTVIGGWTWREKADWPRVAAAWMLVMFFVSPMMMNYYLALAAPAVAVLCGDVLKDGWKNRLGVAAMIGWIVGLVMMGWTEVRWFGVHYVFFGLMLAAMMCGGREIANEEIECKMESERLME